MLVDVSFKNMENSEYIENIISKNVEKVKKRIKMFKNEDPLHLSLHLERNLHRDEYSVRVNLHLPRKVLKAQTSLSSVASSLNKSFSALIKQIDRHKIMLERHLQKKKSTY